MFERKSNKPETREASPAPTVKDNLAQTSTVTAKAARGARAMIGAKVKVNGDIVSNEDLLVEGEVTGTITLTDNELVVGTSGRVQADINAKTIRIEGEVTGDVEGGERVVICASGNVQGNVSAPRVMLEDGGRFKGSIDMGSSKPVSKGASAPPSSASAPAGEVTSIEKAG